jgi:guanosine-3',5'-bis(diphosphate) 3'-pyrophosphohydrolase
MNSLNLIVSALSFASKKHRDQRRKDSQASPYINHPISLVEILVNEAGVTDYDVLAAAILHDTIEDTDTTPEEIELCFGQKICSIVKEVTDDGLLSKEDRKTLQIEHAPFLSKEAGLVKIADKIANLRDLKNSPPIGWSEAQRSDYREWAKKVVNKIKDPNSALLLIFNNTIK